MKTDVFRYFTRRMDRNDCTPKDKSSEASPRPVEMPSVESKFARGEQRNYCHSGDVISNNYIVRGRIEFKDNNRG